MNSELDKNSSLRAVKNFELHSSDMVSPRDLQNSKPNGSSINNTAFLKNGNSFPYDSKLNGNASPVHLPKNQNSDDSQYVMQYLADLNEESVQLINSDSCEEALKLLTQAEDKISQLGQIEPNQETYIITVFYNIA